MPIDSIINDFINQKINIPTYIDKISNLDISKKDLNIYIENYVQTDKMDERMNALLILWFIKHQDFTFNQSNLYISFIKDIVSEITKPNILSYNDDTIITKADNFYFIINHSNHELNIKLPTDIQNKTLYCYNCNDDINLKSSISLPEFSFYALRVD